MLSNNFLALTLTFILSLVWLRINNYAAHRDWISSDLSRKIIHMGTGPLFVVCWLLFTQAPISRFLAAVVPLALTFQFLLVGLGIIQDESAVRAMSRSGDRREILHGPLYYGIIFVVLTLLYWRDSPIGIVAVMLMCGGDGLADVVGRRLGSTKLPWNQNKTWIGTLGMFMGGWIFAMMVLATYVAAGTFSGPVQSYLPGVTVIAVAGTLVESLPFHDIDNITVTLVAVILGHIFF